MKRYLSVLLIVVSLSFTACEKESFSSQEINGTWLLHQIHGGYLGKVSSPDPDPSASTTILKFTENKYEKYVDGQLQESGSYSVVNEEAIINNDEVEHRIIFNKADNAIKTYFKILGDQLILYVGDIGSDGYEMTYERQNEGNL